MNQNNYNNKGMFNSEFLQKSLEDCRKSIEQNAPNIQLLQNAISEVKKAITIFGDEESKQDMQKLEDALKTNNFTLANQIQLKYANKK